MQDKYLYLCKLLVYNRVVSEAYSLCMRCMSGKTTVQSASAKRLKTERFQDGLQRSGLDTGAEHSRSNDLSLMRWLSTIIMGNASGFALS